MNTTAVEDLERGIVCEVEVGLHNVISHVDVPEPLLRTLSRAFLELKAYREGRWVAKCDKCHSPIASHPGKRECDRVPGVYS